MKMTQCLKNEYGEGCSLDRKQKTSKKEKLSKEKLYKAVGKNLIIPSNKRLQKLKFDHKNADT